MGILSARTVWRFVAGALLLILAAALGLWLSRPRLTESEIRKRVISTIESETAQSFYVTGTLNLTATGTVEDTRYLFPPFRLNLGTTTATVRLPGHVTYGFDARELRPEHVSVGPDGLITVTIPPLTILSVEANLHAMEVQTDVGWARTYAGSGQETTREAMAIAQNILRQQAVTHLSDNTQPRVNTARALEILLTPVLRSAGVAQPRFSFRIGPNIIMQPEG